MTEPGPQAAGEITMTPWITPVEFDRGRPIHRR